MLPVSDSFQLGQPSPTLALASPAQVEPILRSLFSQARHRVYVRAERLQFDFFNSRDLLPLLTPLIKSDMRNRVHFLIDDAFHFLNTQSSVIHLARRFSSYVKVHKVLEGYSSQVEFFVVADGAGYLHQPSEARFPVHASAFAPAHAARLEHRFTESWERSESLSELFTAGL